MPSPENTNASAETEIRDEYLRLYNLRPQTNGGKLRKTTQSLNPWEK